MGENLDIVMPVIARDRERLDLFLASWRFNWRIPGKLFLFTRDEDVPLFEELATDPRIEVRTKRSLIGDEVYTFGEEHWHFGTGWYRQQMVKLAAYQVVQGPFYCCLDADYLIAKEIRYEDLVEEGRGKAQTSTVPIDRDQYQVSASLLGAKPVTAEFLKGVPPFILHQEISSRTLRRLGNWQSVLARTRMWTEASLYRTAGEEGWGELHKNVAHDFTDNPFRTALLDPRNFIAWNPAPSFDGEYMFVTVSSTMQIAPKQVWSKLRGAGVLFCQKDLS